MKTSLISTLMILAPAALLATAGIAQVSQTQPNQLASTCANCHGTAGRAQGAMPNLAGQNKAYMVEQLRAFRDGKRPATIMHQLAKGYSDAQIEAIAEHFSRLGAK